MGAHAVGVDMKFFVAKQGAKSQKKIQKTQRRVFDLFYVAEILEPLSVARPRKSADVAVKSTRPKSPIETKIGGCHLVEIVVEPVNEKHHVLIHRDMFQSFVARLVTV